MSINAVEAGDAIPSKFSWGKID